MKHFFQNTFTKIKDYFTANTGRKIFFFGGLTTVIGFTIFGIINLNLPQLKNHSLYYLLMNVNLVLRYISLIGLVAAGIGTLWDSMYTRYLFLAKIRDIQYNHLKEIYDKQGAGEDVEMTATFSTEEKRYLRRRKWTFIGVILLKLFLVIALFSLLLGV